MDIGKTKTFTHESVPSLTITFRIPSTTWLASFAPEMLGMVENDVNPPKVVTDESKKSTSSMLERIFGLLVKVIRTVEGVRFWREDDSRYPEWRDCTDKEKWECLDQLVCELPEIFYAFVKVVFPFVVAKRSDVLG